ncbi:hypothetical protein [Rhodococcus opacus]|uniref:hypothetical protein n=1 Tax=Rhodococcus opacus TaxID=37919 RepID=UPI0029CA9163|nr:hypothetical protein [Rhodococcus opacus]
MPSVATHTVTYEVESAYPEPVELGITSAPVEFIRERIDGVARISGDPVTEVWNDEDGSTVARFESGTHRIYRAEVR